jgi:hypothetical protein
MILNFQIEIMSRQKYQVLVFAISTLQCLSNTHLFREGLFSSQDEAEATVLAILEGSGSDELDEFINETVSIFKLAFGSSDAIHYLCQLIIMLKKQDLFNITMTGDAQKSYIQTQEQCFDVYHAIHKDFLEATIVTLPVLIIHADCKIGDIQSSLNMSEYVDTEASTVP